MEPRFTLSLSNKILLCIVLGVHTIAIILFQPPTPYSIGSVFGTIIAYLGMSFLVAGITWRISGKSHRASSIAFNVILILLALGQLGRANREMDQQRIAQAMKQEQQALRRDLANLDDPTKGAEVMDGYAKSFRGRIGELEKVATGDDKRFYQIMREFTEQQQAVSQKWSDALDVVQSDKVLNFASLKTKQDYAFQRDAVDNYIACTHEYRTMYENMTATLERKLSVFGSNDKRVRGAMAGVNDQYQRQRPVMGPLMAAHAEYGGQMLIVIKTLEANKGKWRYEDDDIQYDDDDVRAIVLHANEKMIECETRINELIGKLQKAL